jgi:hypothetical protein
LPTVNAPTSDVVPPIGVQLPAGDARHPLSVIETPARATTHVGAAAAAILARALETPATPSNPANAPAGPAPSRAPATPFSPTALSDFLRDSARGHGSLWDLAFLVAAVALVIEASRRLALRLRLPQPQFLLLLIERPG